MHTITDQEILHKIIEIQGCIIQGRNLKTLLHKNIDFYLEKSEADIIAICVNEHQKVHIEYVIEKHRLFSHLLGRYLFSKKKLDWDHFVKNCTDHFNLGQKYHKIHDLCELFKGILTQKEAKAFSEEIQMKEAVLMPLYAFDKQEKIGYVCFIFQAENKIDLKKLENIQNIFQTLLQPLHDKHYSIVYSRCMRVDENMKLLTEQEKRIVRKVLNGNSYSEVAETLGISINTLKTHMKNIFNKYRVTSKIELYNKFSSLI
ncbi:MAG: luxR-type protein [Campylobacterota bacterium]|nr:luxR-type protein [Campylobacterota bacterium]